MLYRRLWNSGYLGKYVVTTSLVGGVTGVYDGYMYRHGSKSVFIDGVYDYEDRYPSVHKRVLRSCILGGVGIVLGSVYVPSRIVAYSFKPDSIRYV